MNSLVIRPATPADVDLVLSFIRELAEYERLTHTLVATPASVRDALFGTRPTAEAVLAFWADAPVGFAVYFTNFSTFVGRPGLYLEDLFVRPAARRQGIGKALLAYLARTCVRRGYGRLEWAVLNWNAPAIEFYKRLGARPLEEWTVFRLDEGALQALGSDTQ